MTFDELKEAEFFVARVCSICGGPVGYLVHPELAAVVFDSSCGCGGGVPNYRLATHAELFELPNPFEEDKSDE